jgi:hypothetical protein
LFVNNDMGNSSLQKRDSLWVISAFCSIKHFPR